MLAVKDNNANKVAFYNTTCQYYPADSHQTRSLALCICSQINNKINNSHSTCCETNINLLQQFFLSVFLQRAHCVREIK